MDTTRAVPLEGRRGASRRRAGASAADLVLSLLGAATALTMLLALYLALVYAPRDALTGQIQRVFYFHVPMALAGFLAFFVVFVASALYLWRRSPAVDAVARSSAEVGLVFTTLMIITGSIWGKPVWGTWWSWDPRMTTSLILWFIYLGYLMLRAYAPTREQGARYGAVLGIVGFVDVPIVYMSIVWWRTLHPQPVITPKGASMPGEMLTAFGVSMLAFTLLFFYLLWQRYRIQRLEDRVVELQDVQGDRNG